MDSCPMDSCTKKIMLAFLVVAAASFATGVIKDVATDISHWQGDVDFKQVVESGITVVIHKATQGLTYVDKNYLNNQEAAKSAGLKYWGAYHFAENTDGGQQAEHFLDVAGQADFFAVDLEPYGNKTVCLKQAEDIVQKIIQETGRTPLIYGGAYFLNSFNHSDILAKCPLWVASWRSGEPTLPNMWKNWVLWQHTDGVHGSPNYVLPGIGKCDRDKVNEEEFLQFIENNPKSTLA